MFNLLCLVAFSRALEDRICPLIEGKYRFCITPSAVFNLRESSRQMLKQTHIIKSVPVVRAVFGLKSVREIFNLEIGPIFASTHLLNHFSVFIDILIKPNISQNDGVIT